MSAENPKLPIPTFSDDGEPQVIIERSTTYPFLGQLGGSLLMIVLATVLTVGIFAWKGYSPLLLGTIPIGDNQDTLGNTAVIEQAMKNLLTFPADLTQFTTFYPEPNSMVYTIAPYGIAVAALPLYLLTGHNGTLAVNLYFLACYVLTAWGIYLLVRYLFSAPLGVALLAGLITCFAQYTYIEIPHITTLSTQFLIFGLYFLHRFLDEAKLRWGLGVGICFWLTFFASGYLGFSFIFAALIIVLLTLIWRRRQLSGRLFLYALIVAVFLGIASYPFITMRLNASTVSTYDAQALQPFSATVLDWFSGTSMLYRWMTPLRDERTLFLGVTPIILALLAWRYRRQGQPARNGSRLSSGQIVLLYSLITLVGYFLTFGMDITLAPGISIPSPYRLLYELPGFSFIRVPARFMVMAVIGTSVLAAFTLAALSRRLSSTRFRLVFGLCSVLLLVELWPYSALLNPDSGTFRMNQTLPPVPAKAYAWLDAQPTPVALHYPYGPDYDNYYMYETQQYHQSMVNGNGSFAPPWYGFLYGNAFPDAISLDFLQTYQIPYVFVHRRLLTDDALKALDAAIEQATYSGRLSYVDTLDNVDIYRVSGAQNNVRYEFDLFAPGSGWQDPEKSDGSTFTWSDATPATLELPLPTDSSGDLELNFRIDSAMPKILDSLTVEANHQTMTLSMKPDGDGTIYSGIIPHQWLGANAQKLSVAFHTGQPVSPADIGLNPDKRTLGANFDWVNLGPRPELYSIDPATALDGQGWGNAETTDDGTHFHWMTTAAATLNLASTPIDDLGLIFQVDSAISPDILDSLTLRANGQPIALVRIPDSAPPLFEAVIPRGTVAAKPDAVQLTFVVNRTMTPHDANPSLQDMRQLAIALGGVWYYPLRNLHLPIGAIPVGDGWTTPVSSPNETNFRWMNATEAQMSLPLPGDESLPISLDVVQSAGDLATQNFTLKVNHLPVTLTPETTAGHIVLTGVIPAEALAASTNGVATLTFAVDQLKPLTPTDDAPQYGLAFGALKIQDNDAHPNAIQVNLGTPFTGSGWHDPEIGPNQTSFRWMSATTATIEVTPPKPQSLVLEAQIESSITPEIERSLKLAVNGQAIPFAPDNNGSATYRAVIPPEVVQSNPSTMTLTFTVDALASAQSLGQGVDTRPLGVAFSQLTLYPAGDVTLNFDHPLDGTGWHDPEKDSMGGFQWMSAARATVTIPFQPSGTDEQVVLKVAQSLTPEILSSLKLEINGDPVTLNHSDPLPSDGSLWWGTVPASTLDKSDGTGTLEVAFIVDKIDSPQSLGRGDDARELGIALRWLMLIPPDNAAPANTPATGLAG